MSKYQLTSFSVVLLNLGTLVSSLANDYSYIPPPPPPPSLNCPPLPLSPSPKPPPPPIVNPTPPPTVVRPPPPPPPEANPTPPPPVVKPPPPPTPEAKPTPPPLLVTPPPPPPPNVGYPPPPKQQTCPINALELGACVDVLGLIHIGLAHDVKKKCCPLLYGLADLDAAICLCTAIRIKALNLIDILVPICLHVLVNDCGKHPPVGFQCPTN